LAVRRLDSSEAAALRDAALRTCGFGRVADFVRAAGLCAAHETLGSRSAAAGWYSTLHLVDNRRRRDPGPVCHNVFSTLPVYVPCELAGDRAATADLIRDQTAAALASGLMQ